jgi:hypothetical protein
MPNSAPTYLPIDVNRVHKYRDQQRKVASDALRSGRLAVSLEASMKLRVVEVDEGVDGVSQL